MASAVEALRRFRQRSDERQERADRKKEVFLSEIPESEKVHDSVYRVGGSIVWVGRALEGIDLRSHLSPGGAGVHKIIAENGGHGYLSIAENGTRKEYLISHGKAKAVGGGILEIIWKRVKK